MIVLVFILSVLAALFLGVALGIHDCKVTFSIPRGATQVYEISDGFFTYDKTIADIYGKIDAEVGGVDDGECHV